MTKPAADPTPAPEASTLAPARPLFYGKPEPVSADTHASLRLRDAGFGFSSGSNAVPLVGGEFVPAARAYPVVFAREDGWPVALLGLGVSNSYVDGDGAWAPETYVPAYVRRYPFAFIITEDRFVLAIDRDAPAVSETDGEPLFEGGKPGPILTRALEFCGQFQESHRTTRAFVDALREHDLLVDRVADAKFPDARSMRLGGFQVIDRQRWLALPDAVVLTFHKLGWDELVFAHFWSLDRFAFLMERATKPGATAA